MSPKVDKKRKTSQLWTFFTPIDECFANCNMCKQKLSFKTSTSNLKKHLQNKHPTVQIPAENTRRNERSENQTAMQPSTSSTSTSSQPSVDRTSQEEQLSIATRHISTTLVQATIDTLLPKKISGRSKDKINSALLGLFIHDFQPFSIVEDKGFQKFVTVLNPNYELPSRHLISKTLIPAIYEECQTKIRALVSTGKTFCITTDSWSSINTVSYNAITAHFLDDNFNQISVLLECAATDVRHTSKNLSLELRRITMEWGIKDKVILAVSDHAPNIVGAIQSVGWKHFGCMAHALNLIVKDSLKVKNVETIINKVKEVVVHFKRSNIAADKLKKYQENLGKTVSLKLILEVATRWNSTSYMIQRFIELEEAIKSTVAVIDKDLPILTAAEWTVIKELCQILRPFEDATKSISGQKYSTSSMVIPICNGIRKTLYKLSQKQFSEPVKQVLQLLEIGYNKRLGNVENSNTLFISTFLDPKFKQIGFSNETIANSVKQKIINMIAAKITIKSRKDPIPGTSNMHIDVEDKNVDDGNDEDDTSIWSDFDKSVAAHQPKGTSTSRAIIEMQRYLEEEIASRSQSDSFLWWQQHKQMLPHLSEIAQERLCTMASSVPCERIFSKAGQVLTARRNRLKDKTVQQLLFLNSNYQL